MKIDKNMIKSWLIRLVLPMVVKYIQNVVIKMSPKIREEIIEKIQEWDEKAKKTANKWDDIGLYLLKIVTGLEV